jgi:hypothetical protein
MRDYVASFYGGYDPVRLRRTSRLHISWTVVAIAVAVVVLVVLVAADVSAYESRPAVVTVTSVGWYGEGYLLTTGPGFTVHGSQVELFPLTCRSLCLPWNGASVSAPFQFVSFSVAYGALQYTNVTVRAPATAYDGPLSIFLEVP